MKKAKFSKVFKNSYLLPLNESCLAFSELKLYKVLMPYFYSPEKYPATEITYFHFLWFYSIASLTVRSQAPVLEEDMHRHFPSSKKDNENPKTTLNGDFSKDIFVLVCFFALCGFFFLFFPVHT